MGMGIAYSIYDYDRTNFDRPKGGDQLVRMK